MPEISTPVLHASIVGVTGTFSGAVSASSYGAVVATTGSFSGTIVAPKLATTGTRLALAGGSVDVGFRNFADNANNVVITDAGVVALRGAVTASAGAGDIVAPNNKGLRGTFGADTINLIKIDANAVVQVASALQDVFASVGTRVTASIPASSADYKGCIVVDGTTVRRLVFFDKDGNRAYVDGTSF